MFLDLASDTNHFFFCKEIRAKTRSGYVVYSMPTSLVSLSITKLENVKSLFMVDVEVQVIASKRRRIVKSNAAIIKMKKKDIFHIKVETDY